MSTIFVYVHSSLGICISQSPIQTSYEMNRSSRIVNMKLQEIIFYKEIESQTFQFQKTHTGLFQDTRAIEHKNL